MYVYTGNLKGTFNKCASASISEAVASITPNVHEQARHRSEKSAINTAARETATNDEWTFNNIKDLLFSYNCGYSMAVLTTITFKDTLYTLVNLFRIMKHLLAWPSPIARPIL